MNHKKLKDSEFIEKYNEGLSHQELSAHFGVSPTTVQVYVKRLKLPKRELIDEIDKERLTELWQKGYSCSMIGREFHVCETTVMRIARKLGLKERALKNSTIQVAYTSIIPIPTKRPKAKSDKTHKFVVPPTLKQLEKQKQQAEVAKAERDYKIYRRDCGYMALQEETD